MSPCRRPMFNQKRSEMVSQAMRMMMRPLPWNCGVDYAAAIVPTCAELPRASCAATIPDPNWDRHFVIACRRGRHRATCIGRARTP